MVATAKALSLPEVENDAALDLAGAHAGEDAIDVLEALGRNRRLHLALTGEVERLPEVQARAHDRPAYRDAIQDRVEDGEREVARRQADQRYRSAAPDHSHRLLEGLRRNRRDEDTLGPANFLFHEGDGIGLARVHHERGAEPRGELE